MADKNADGVPFLDEKPPLLRRSRGRLQGKGGLENPSKPREARNVRDRPREERAPPRAVSVAFSDIAFTEESSE